MTPRSQPLHRRALWTAAVTARAPLEARFPFRSPEAIERAQRRRLRATVDHAYEHVPYYRETMRRLGLTPADIARAEDIARLPLIERDELQRDPEYFVSRALPAEKRLEVRTSGSTGEPIVFWRDPRSLLQRVIGFQRLEPVLALLTGTRLRRRQALIAAPDSSTTGVNKAVRHRLLPSVRTVHQVFSLFTPPAELAAGDRAVRARHDHRVRLGGRGPVRDAPRAGGAGPPSERRGVCGRPAVGADARRDIGARRERAERVPGGGDADDRVRVRAARRAPPERGPVPAAI